MKKPQRLDTATLSLRQACAQYQLGWRVLNRAIAANEIPVARLGLRRLTILRADVERWIAAHALRNEYEPAEAVERTLAKRRARERAA